MDIADAAYHTVHDYPGGAEALAVRLGKRGSSLSHEVRPPVGSSAKFGLLDAVTAMELSGDRRILNAIAGRLNCIVIPMPQIDDSDGSAHHVARVAAEFGELMAEVATSVSDGHVSANELARVNHSYAEMTAVCQRMLAHLAALHEEAKPRGQEGRGAHSAAVRRVAA